MDYKELIIEMIDKADDKRLKTIYHFIKSILGLD